MHMDCLAPEMFDHACGIQARAWLRLLTAALLLSAVTGCSALRWQQSDVTLEPVPLEGFQIRSLSAYQAKGSFFLTGLVRRKSSSYRGVGHVDVSIRGPDGELVGEVSANYYPESVHYVRPQESHFHIVIDSAPASESAVTVTQHVGDVHPVESPLAFKTVKTLLFGFPVDPSVPGE